MPVWSSSADSGSIEISENATEPTVIPLDANTEVFIYNWDAPFPKKEELTMPLDSLGTFQDNDFKWIYQLLTPPRGSWQTWLGTDPFLPAPRSLKFLTASPAAAPIQGDPPISTCDGSRSRGLQIA